MVLPGIHYLIITDDIINVFRAERAGISLSWYISP